MLPAATPRPIIDKVNEWFTQIVRSEESRRFLNSFGGDPFVNSPDAAQDLFLKSIKDWGDYVRIARIVPQ
jgi:tripartite-type tricarboxylate transporter receptor subunit TctC